MNMCMSNKRQRKVTSAVKWRGAVDLSYPNSQTRRGRVQEEGMICPTITAQQTGVCIIEKSRQDDDQ